jgi:hypothetical protein
MLSMGLVVSLGLLVILAKLDWKKKIWVISHPLTMDIGVFILLTLIHWGTFSGVMVATVGALFTSLTLSLMKWLYGHIENNRYFPGVFNILDKIKDP